MKIDLPESLVYVLTRESFPFLDDELIERIIEDNHEKTRSLLREEDWEQIKGFLGHIVHVLTPSELQGGARDAYARKIQRAGLYYLGNIEEYSFKGLE